MKSPFDTRLQSYVGQPGRPPRVAADEVNLPMIRRWVDAIGDANPIYLDHEHAVATGRTGIVAPPAMLGVWTAKGYRETLQEATTATGVIKELAAAGFTTTPGTNLRHEYLRELQLGDRLRSETVVGDVSSLKQTALGPGHFVTNVTTYFDQHGDTVGIERLRVFAFKPNPPAAGPFERPLPRRTEQTASADISPGPLATLAAGDVLPPLDITLDRVGVIVCTTACSDFRGGHYDPDLAHAIGTRDLFTDIPTSAGFTQRFVTNWAGPNGRMRSIELRLGVPFFAGDTLQLRGRVTAVDGCVTVSVIGTTEGGRHIEATVELTLN